MNNKKSVKIYKYTAIFEPDQQSGGFTVTIPALPGCVTEGNTFEEAIKMAKDAIQCYLCSLKKHHESIPEESNQGFTGVINVPIKEISLKR